MFTVNFLFRYPIQSSNQKNKNKTHAARSNDKMLWHWPTTYLILFVNLDEFLWNQCLTFIFIFCCGFFWQLYTASQLSVRQKKNVFLMTDFYLAQNKNDIINDQNKSVLFKPADTNLSKFHFLQWEYFHLWIRKYHIQIKANYWC